jgi:hypothetical protein
MHFVTHQPKSKEQPILTSENVDMSIFHLRFLDLSHCCYSLSCGWGNQELDTVVVGGGGLYSHPRNEGQTHSGKQG